MAAKQQVRVLAGACLAIGLIITACGGGTSDDSLDTTASAGEPTGTQTAPTESSLPDSAPAPSVPEIVAAQWRGFCALDPSLRFGSDPAAWNEHTRAIEEALAAGGEELSDDAKELIERLTTLEDSHRALNDAIEAAKADQSVVDCTTGTCDVLVGDSGVLLLDEDAFRSESGNIIPLPVEEELRAVQDATRALVATADGLGLDACNLLTGEQATSPAPEPTSPTATEAAPAGSSGFEEQFDGRLEDGWRWSLEDPGTWSLAETPGWLQITAVESLQNVLLRPAPDTAYEVTTAVSFRPTSNFQIAGLVAAPRGGQTVTLLQLGRAYCDPLAIPGLCVGDGVYFDKIEDGATVNSIVSEIATNTDVLYLRLLVEGDSYSGYFSEDGEIWTLVGTQVASYIDTDIGLIAHQALEEPAAASFDYLTVTSPPVGDKPLAATGLPGRAPAAPDADVWLSPVAGEPLQVGDCFTDTGLNFAMGEFPKGVFLTTTSCSGDHDGSVYALDDAECSSSATVSAAASAESYSGATPRLVYLNNPDSEPQYACVSMNPDSLLFQLPIGNSHYWETPTQQPGVR